MAITKLFEDKPSVLLNTINKLVSDYEKNIEIYTKDIEKEELACLKSNMAQTTNDFVLYLEQIIKITSESIITSLAGCNISIPSSMTLGTSGLLNNGMRNRLVVD